MKKPYLITVCSFTLGVKRYLSTLHRLEDSASVVFVDCEPHTHDIAGFRGFTRDFRHIKEDMPYPGHHGRWFLVPEDLDPNRWWIFTDTHDVIFQAPIPDLDQYGNIDVFVQAEGMTHENNWFWKKCIDERWPELKYLYPMPVYCCGVTAMRGHVFRDYQRFLSQWKPEIWDQLPFNTFLSTVTYGNLPKLSAALFDNFNKRLYRTGETFKWTKTGEIPAIVHGNGSSKEWL